MLVSSYGYVRPVETMGNDLSVVNAARARFAKEKYSFDEGDRKLIQFLWDRQETSPFRHAAVTFEIKAPLMVARQWWKYAVGSTHIDSQNGWNEVSRRYVSMTPDFYMPEHWREAPENAKQGSGAPVDFIVENDMSNMLQETYVEGVRRYEAAMQAGICAEQARLFLPAYGMYVVWRWTASLESTLHFLRQRLADKAQAEIREYAEQVFEHMLAFFPVTMEVVFGVDECKRGRDRFRNRAAEHSFGPVLSS